MPVEELSVPQARRIALAAQGLVDRGPPGGSTAATSPGWSTRSACCRSTRSTCSRGRTTCRVFPLGPYPRERLYRMSGTTGRCSSTGRTRRPCCRLGYGPTCSGAWRTCEARVRGAESASCPPRVPGQTRIGVLVTGLSAFRRFVNGTLKIISCDPDPRGAAIRPCRYWRSHGVPTHRSWS